VGEIMRRDFPSVKESDPLMKVQDLMQEGHMRSLPVMRDKEVIGVVTLEDIGRIYAIVSQR
jgi:CBS domain-containing protein